MTHKIDRIFYWHARFDMSEFAERLRLLRESRQLTQIRLAELIQVDPRAYNRWERGSIAPHLDTLVRIADVLQVSLDELVGRKPVSGEARIRNHSLNALWQQADVLPDQEQQALILVIDSFVKKSIVEKTMGLPASGRRATSSSIASSALRSSKRAAAAQAV